MLHTQPCPPMRALDASRGAASSRARARLSADQATENLTPIEVKQPPNVENPGDPVATNELRICRWLTPRGAGDAVATRLNFPENDPDRILIEFNMSGSQSPTIKFHLKTTGGPSGYNDAGADMVFKQDPPNSGHFVSEPIVLVADSDDDNLAIGPNRATVHDGNEGDRSFIAYPGGKLVIEGGVLTQPVEFQIEKPVKELAPIFIILDPTTDGSFATQAISVLPDQLMRMQQFYAKLRIKVKNGNWFVMDRAQIQQLNSEGSILSILNNLTAQARPDCEDTRRIFLNSNWKAAFTAHGGTLPDKPAPIVLLPNIIMAQILGQSTTAAGFTTDDMCFISVPEITRPINVPTTRVTITHELGHLLKIRSDHGDPFADPGSIKNYHLMRMGGFRNPVEQPDANPDSSGKHLRFQDGVDALSGGAPFLTNHQ